MLKLKVLPVCYFVACLAACNVCASLAFVVVVNCRECFVASVTQEAFMEPICNLFGQMLLAGNSKGHVLICFEKVHSFRGNPT